MSEAEFYNEVCGESYDHGQKLISVTDIRRAAVLPPKNDLQGQKYKIDSGYFTRWGLGVDWGGGGLSGISKTAVCMVGLRGDGVIEVFSGWRSETPNNFNLEAERIKQLAYLYKADFVAMDFHGTGNRLRLDKFLETQYPPSKIEPVSYLRVGNGA